ncbi:hypothetical protein H7J77_00185 [Mycolicibacillus parakoreensis]|uniref:Uncharacterized protein n=1 Tax=Mycolicibacillus parakoreensis TaxID=1069221 RepID=A0ABY3U869_9MYCO|nr:hypothetical protein [Mycolicibacillus parakoreensis]MCV7313969.1 hypothetical protein [Mycolicibacillus parakoreensis]ULN54161.1 hypothetical protein MIU77_07835 [Mycolicibacillus parakoreensis]
MTQVTGLRVAITGGARGAGPLPAALVDGAFRLAGGEKVTAGLNHAERVAYQARIEGRNE